MTAVIEVGPVTVRGPQPVDDESAAAAVEFVDAGSALVGEQAVPTDALWHDVIRAAAGTAACGIVLVHPAAWTPSRVRRVQVAAAGCAVDVVAVPRADAIRMAAAAPEPAVVEIGPEVIVVTDDDVTAIPRVGDDDRIVQQVADAATARAATTVVDAPADVPGARRLAAAVSLAVQTAGGAVECVDRRAIRRAVETLCAPAERPPEPDVPARRGRRGIAIVTAAALAAAGWAMGGAGPDDRPVGEPETLLVEGRVAVKVPALWPVQRVTAGPGSARVEVSAPIPGSALMLTQSAVATGTTLTAVADVLRSALENEPPGVFTGLVADRQRAGRNVVAYRENRAGRGIDWSVFVDGAVRIAVGCQTAAGVDVALVRACDEAVRSAHAIS